MNDISWMISSNSKVRIDVSSSNFPYYNAHPNVDKIWSETSEKNVVNQTNYFGGDFTSRIILPIMENKNSKKNNNKIIFIVGIIIIAISLILLICIAAFLCYKKNNFQKKAHKFKNL